MLPAPDHSHYWLEFKKIYLKELIEKEYRKELQRRAQEMTDRLFGFTSLPEEYYKDYQA